jgi:hypothetical protein
VRETPRDDDSVYVERVSSPRTRAVFVVLALMGLLLLAWQATTRGLGVWAVVFFCVFAMFLFYSVNYRTLLIRLTPESLQLRFGVFQWVIPLGNVEACSLDDVSLWRIGGAGIHFSPMRGRYRAMFNFLEHPRVVVNLKVKKGPVGAIAFSTRRPDEVIRLIRERAVVVGGS